MPVFNRIVLLGHSGFIGAALCRALATRPTAAELVARSYPELDLARRDEAMTLAPLLGPDTALILLSGIKRQLGESLDVFERNMAMVANVAQCLQRHPAGRLIYISSAAVYGEEVHNTAITEDTPVCPGSYYGISKYAAERLFLRLRQDVPTMSLALVRPPLVYGPGDVSRSYGPAGFIKTALERKPIVLWGGGDELREFLFVDDLARILADLIHSDYSGALNAVSGRSHSFQEVIAALRDALGGDLTVEERPRSKRKVDNAFDNARLRQVLPEMVFTPLAMGIRRTLAAERGQPLPD